MNEQEFFNKIKELQKQRDLLKKDVTVLECKINELRDILELKNIKKGYYTNNLGLFCKVYDIKGDVLISNDGGTEVIFDKWYDDTYTSFYCKHYLNSEDKNKIVYYEEFLCTTERYSLEDKDIAQTYINTIEKRLDGNLETLEIEKQPKFKDGDILSCDEDSFTRHTTLILHKDENITESIVSLIRHKKLVETNVPIDNFLLSRLYHAREDEKKELFDALAKGGKAWDAEKKIIVNLKHKCEFKPFDKVLGRNEKDDVWEADLFSHYREESQYPFRCIGFSRKYCIPYEGNEHLLGTTDNFE